MLVAASPRGLCAVLFGDDPQTLRAELQRCFPEAQPQKDQDERDEDERCLRVVRRLSEFIASPQCRPGLVTEADADLSLDLRGTPFQLRVWQALRAIPPGQTASYEQIARAIDAPTAARAVARACAANPLAVLVPCHRVVRKDGALSGYRWGVWRKEALLAREAALPG